MESFRTAVELAAAIALLLFILFFSPKKNVASVVIFRVIPLVLGLLLAVSAAIGLGLAISFGG